METLAFTQGELEAIGGLEHWEVWSFTRIPLAAVLRRDLGCRQEGSQEAGTYTGQILKEEPVRFADGLDVEGRVLGSPQALGGWP